MKNYEITEKDNVLSLKVFAKSAPKTFQKRMMIGIIVTFCAFYGMIYWTFGQLPLFVDLVVGIVFLTTLFKRTNKYYWFSHGVEELHISPLADQFLFFKKIKYVFDKTEFSMNQLRYVGLVKQLNFPNPLMNLTSKWKTADKISPLCFVFSKSYFFESRDHIVHFGAALTNTEATQVKREIEQFLEKYQVRLEVT